MRVALKDARVVACDARDDPSCSTCGTRRFSRFTPFDDVPRLRKSDSALHSIYDERLRYLEVLVESLQEKQCVIIGTVRAAHVEAHDARDGSVLTYVRYEALQQDEGHKRTSCDDVSYLTLQVLAKHHEGSLLQVPRSPMLGDRTMLQHEM